MLASFPDANPPVDLPIALCLGNVSQELVDLWRDVLAEVCIRVCADLPVGKSATLVLMGVGHDEIKRAVASARRAAGSVPIVAVLPIQDRRLAAGALLGGADACYVLGSPLVSLRVLVAQLLISHWTRTGRGVRPSSRRI
jgi:hypothetical protein